MYLRHYSLFFAVLCFPFWGGLSAQNTIIINDADLLDQTYVWTSDNEYLLNGFVVLEEGGQLTIEPGTVIRGRSAPEITSSDITSALVIARGARIIADGRPDAPIIFTAEEDDLSTPDDFLSTDRGEWGGLVILGTATVSTPVGFNSVDGLHFDDLRFSYGGGLTPNDADDSGILRYISIRHAGGLALLDSELNALTLGGVGSGTTIDHVEVFACQDDGFEFLGGTVNAYHLVAAHCGDEAFDFDEGYQGVGQFWLGISSGGRMLEIDGASPDDQPPFSVPDLANLTLIVSEPENLNTDETSLLFRDNAGGSLENVLFVYRSYDEFFDKIALEDRSDSDAGDSYARWQSGDLSLTNNFFNTELGPPIEWRDLAFAQDESELLIPASSSLFQNYMADNNTLTNQFVIGSSDPLALDPLPLPGSPILTGGTPITRPGFTQVPYQGAFGNDNWMDWTFLSGNVALSQYITGTVFQADENCIANTAAPAPGVTVTLETNGITHFTTTNAGGQYRAFVPEGTTLVTPLAPSSAWAACLPGVSVTVADGETRTADLAISPVTDCALPSIDIGAPFLRRGFTSNYHLTYYNSGATTAENPEITVVLDPLLSYEDSSIPLTEQRGDTLVFAVEDLPALSSPRRFFLMVKVSLDAELGWEHCTTAIIDADNICELSGGAELRVSGECVGDSVRFEVRNVGDAEPLAPVPYIVIEDEVMLITEPFSPAPGTTEEFFFPAAGQTFNFSTLARPDDVDPGIVAATVSCADNPETPFSSFATLGPLPNSAVDCQPNIGAYDPNDKAATPAGVTEDNIVPKEVVLDYRIRFQNTGTDTAFTVVVVDTLPEVLDLATFTMGAYSHPCTWTLEGERTLKVTFDNIMLPDSNVNEPASNGFFYFTIAAKAGLDWGTEIRNEADIYFDFNAPVRTNQTYHLIDQLMMRPLAVEEPLKGRDALLVYPQPAGEEVTIAFRNGEPLKGEWTIFTIDGRAIKQGMANGFNRRIPLVGLTPGVHLLVLRDGNQQLLARQRLLVN